MSVLKPRLSDSDVTRVYGSKRCRVAHLLHAMDSPNGEVAAICTEVTAIGAKWMGTGSMDEIERARDLPLCVDCERRWAFNIVRQMREASRLGNWGKWNKIIEHLDDPWRKT